MKSWAAVIRVIAIGVLGLTHSAVAQHVSPPQKAPTPHVLTVYWTCENGINESGTIEIPTSSLAACEALTDEDIEEILRDAFPDFNCCDEDRCEDPIIMTETDCAPMGEEEVPSFSKSHYGRNVVVCPWKVALTYNFGNGRRRGFVGRGRSMCEARNNAWCQVCKYARKNCTCIYTNTGKCTVRERPCCCCR